MPVGLLELRACQEAVTGFLGQDGLERQTPTAVLGCFVRSGGDWAAVIAWPSSCPSRCSLNRPPAAVWEQLHPRPEYGTEQPGATRRAWFEVFEPCL